MEKNNKRPFDDGDQHHGDSIKKLKVVHGPLTSEPKSTKEVTGIQNLCDDVIMHIFKYLPHSDLAMMPQ